MESGCFRFQPIHLWHKEKIESLAVQDGTPSCQHTFANIYSLQGIYRTRVAFTREMAILRVPGMDEPGYAAYRFPFGNADPLAGVEEILTHTKRQDKKCLFYNITADQRRLLDNEMPGKWAFAENRDWAEYLYKTEKFQACSGDKLRKKRQHIRKFSLNYGRRYSLDSISPYNAGEVEDYQERWFRDKTGAQEENTETGIPNLWFENEKIHKELSEFDALGLKGLALYIDGSVRGYCYGVAITPDAVDYLVLKGDRDVPGVCAMLTHSFILACHRQGYSFVNFEEDIGLAGLRQMKNSYAPDLLLLKYVAREV